MLPDMSHMVVCSKSDCTSINPQPETNFYRRKTRKSGRHPECKVCSNSRMKEWRKKNPEKLAAKQRRDSLARLYFKDMTGTQALIAWNKMFAAQDGKCGICKKDPATDTDHCHKTGKIRGLLCNPCNLLLGKIEKRPGFVLSMNSYLGISHDNT
jgi:recombination endonuclease VII